MSEFLELPNRTSKPRANGISLIIDNGRPTMFFKDVVESHQNLIDIVKFGWGTSIVTADLKSKIDFLNQKNISYFFGGTLFEKAFVQGRFEDFVSFAKENACEYVEISDGTIELDSATRSELVELLAKDFKVLTEVGFKDPEKSKVFAPKDWVKTIKADFDAGAYKVITEARESGTSGICRSDGEVRFGLIEEILSSGIDSENMIFEAPKKTLQTYFIEKLGANVNLGNIAFEDVVALETLRLGLRSDTFFTFEGSEG